MNFRIVPVSDPLEKETHLKYTWRMELEDQAICSSPPYATEKECRSKLARAKRAMGGAKFAKVLKNA